MVSPGVGGQPTTEGGELERLWEVAQTQIVRPQPVLQRGSEDTGLDPGCSAGPVDLHHLVEFSQVEADRPCVVTVQAWLDTADDRRTAAVGDHGDVRAGAPVEHVDDFLLGRGPHDEVGNMVQVAREVAHHVAERLAVCVGGAVGRIVRAQRRQPGRGGQARGSDTEFGDRGYRYRGQVGLWKHAPDPADQLVEFGS